MLEQIDSKELERKLPEILRRVEAGETFTVISCGKPVADIIPSRAADRRKSQMAIRNILNSKKPSITDEYLREFISGDRK